MKRMTKAERAIKEDEALYKKNQETINRLIEDNKELALRISLMEKLIARKKK